MVAIIMFKINPKMKLRKHYIYKEIKENKVLGNKFNKRSTKLTLWKLLNIAERNFKRPK